FFPALAGAATVWLAGKLAREMGGGAFAQVLAALAVICVPIYLVMHHWLTMNAFEPLVWMACVWCIIRAINRDNACYWIWFGGLIWLFLGHEGRRFRVLGIVYIVLLATFIVLRGKNYYLASIYPLLFAAGAVGLENITNTRGRSVRAVYAFLVLASAVILA